MPALCDALGSTSRPGRHSFGACSGVLRLYIGKRRHSELTEQATRRHEYDQAAHGMPYTQPIILCRQWPRGTSVPQGSGHNTTCTRTRGRAHKTREQRCHIDRHGGGLKLALNFSLRARVCTCSATQTAIFVHYLPPCKRV